MSHLIEVVSAASSHNAPGWAYVPEVRRDSTEPGRTAAGGRKRGARESGIGTGDGTARQRNAIARRLVELDRENHKDVHIPVPTKQKDSAAKSSRSKTTSNVRRILMSQKTFKNYLDDEEAAAALAPPTNQRPTATRTAKSAAIVPKTGSKLSERSTPIFPAQPTSKLITSEFDNDPLLRSYNPSAPSERIMQALLAEPPLSYKASRATYSSNLNPKPPRVFCAICGYWGKLTCIACQTRVCGLDCHRTHRDTTCNRFYG